MRSNETGDRQTSLIFIRCNCTHESFARVLTVDYIIHNGVNNNNNNASKAHTNVLTSSSSSSSSLPLSVVPNSRGLVYLFICPYYADKEVAKRLGAIWDANNKEVVLSPKC